MTTPPNSAGITVTTAADTNILVDVFLPDEVANSTARALLSAARQRSPLIICDIVYAELVPNFESRNSLDAALRTVGATVSPIDSDIAYTAGLRWGQYRRAGGPRTRILARLPHRRPRHRHRRNVPEQRSRLLLNLLPRTANRLTRCGNRTRLFCVNGTERCGSETEMSRK